MLRLIRKILLGAVLIVAVAGLGLAGWVYLNSDRLAAMMLDRIRSATHLDLQVAHASVRLGSHLNLVLDHPSFVSKRGERFAAGRMRIAFSFHSLISGNPLPLYELSIAQARIAYPLNLIGQTYPPILPVRRDVVEALDHTLTRFASFTRKIRITDALLTDMGGRPVMRNLDVFATHHHFGPARWNLRFKCVWEAPPFKDLDLAGDITTESELSTKLGAGRFWFWNGSLNAVSPAANLELFMRPQGTIDFIVDRSGSNFVNLSSEADLHSIVLKRHNRPQSVPLGAYKLNLTLAVLPERATLSTFAISRADVPVLSVSGFLDYGSVPSVIRGSLTGLTLDAAKTASLLDSLVDLPRWATEVRMSAGRVQVETLALECAFNDLKSDPVNTIRKNLSALVRLDSVALKGPGLAGIPAISQLNAQLSIAKQRLTLTQGSARAGLSNLSNVGLTADLSGVPKKLPYDTKAEGDAVLSELWPVFSPRLAGNLKTTLAAVQKISGSLRFRVNARGELTSRAFARPASYSISLSPRDVQARIKSIPDDLNVVGGAIAITPGRASIESVSLVSTSGAVKLTGGVIFTNDGVRTNDFRVELMALLAERWLPVLFTSSSISLFGPVSGPLQITYDSARLDQTSVKGDLKISPSRVQLGFVRNPIENPNAALSLDGAGAELDLIGSRFEGRKLDLKLKVADYHKPAVEIFAVAEYLDLEALRFIRLPWSPKTKVDFFGRTTAFGHVEARGANLDKLPMTNLKTDFFRDADTWHVYNMELDTFDGHAIVELSGRAKDDWIHMQGHIEEAKLGPLLMLASSPDPPIVTGLLQANADLWANTNTDFFATLSGNGSFVLHDGVVKRLRLLSRMLATIDLTTWLTANIPDPRVAGVPYRTLVGSFAGSEGDFYTGDIVLNGPAMGITSNGSVNVGRKTLDIHVGMYPFSTMDKVIGFIPIIGKLLAPPETGLFGAYFRVYGPVANPTIVPSPIRSVSEILKRTLGLPINIFRPDTIK
ncbi:MAG TPA: AsmA-like C-terminal region-containing protein [Candidatus Binataceae bacterium]